MCSQGILTAFRQSVGRTSAPAESCTVYKLGHRCGKTDGTEAGDRNYKKKLSSNSTVFSDMKVKHSQNKSHILKFHVFHFIKI